MCGSSFAEIWTITRSKPFTHYSVRQSTRMLLAFVNQLEIRRKRNYYEQRLFIISTSGRLPEEALVHRADVLLDNAE